MTRSVASRKAAVERAARWAAANPERVRENKRRYLEKNRTGSILARKKRWLKEHPERAREACRRWHKKNPAKVVVKNAKRRALQRAALVPLTPHEQADVIAIYAKARALSELVGEPYHVDHIVPLAKGGQHHPSNLQVLLGRENLKKGART